MEFILIKNKIRWQFYLKVLTSKEHRRGEIMVEEIRQDLTSKKPRRGEIMVE